jgi:hypothetical protein
MLRDRLRRLRHRLARARNRENESRKLKGFVFIGHHKVGSTALQHFFAQNSLKLIKHGILYPSVESEGMTFLLRKALEGNDRKQNFSINIREPHNALAFRMLSSADGRPIPPYHGALPDVPQMETILHNQFEHLRPHTAIFCSEVMANFGAVDPGLIGQFLKMVPTDDLEIHATLRRPDDYLVSWHGQRLKFGHKLSPLSADGLEKYFDSIHFDYRLMLEAWIERVGADRVRLRNYADVLATGGSVEDFLEQIAIDMPGGLLPSRSKNPSISNAWAEIMRRAHIDLPRPEARALHEYLTSISDKLDLPKNNAVEMFGAENRRRLYDAFLPIEVWLREISGREAFFPDLDLMLDERPVPERIANQKALAQLTERIDTASEIPKSTVEFVKDMARAHGLP